MPGEKAQYYENLIQISMRDNTYIFAISDESIEEVNFMLNMEPFNDPETYVNTGTSQLTAIMKKDSVKGIRYGIKASMLHTNE